MPELPRDPASLELTGAFARAGHAQGMREPLDGDGRLMAPIAAVAAP
ncbi:MAG: hypothetical protein M3N04_05025 [Actinomycetota bacterium]|nr:hypothetical protein [Actinomycetota bacterium]